MKTNNHSQSHDVDNHSLSDILPHYCTIHSKLSPQLADALAAELNDKNYSCFNTCLNHHHKPKYILAPIREGGLLLVKLKTIMYLEADNHYTYIYKKDGTTITSTRLLKDFENYLPCYKFRKISRSIIVNLRYVQKIFRGRNSHIVLKNGKYIHTSERRKDDYEGIIIV